MQVFNLVILLALGERLLRADTEIVENNDGDLVVRDIEGSVRERVSSILHTSSPSIIPILCVTLACLYNSEKQHQGRGLLVSVNSST